MLNMIDSGSKFAFSYFIGSKTGSEVLKCLKLWRLIESNVVWLHSDNGTEFTNMAVEEWCKEQKLIQVFNRPYTPRDAGAVEAFNKTIKTLLRYLLFD